MVQSIMDNSSLKSRKNKQTCRDKNKRQRIIRENNVLNHVFKQKKLLTAWVMIISNEDIYVKNYRTDFYQIKVAFISYKTAFSCWLPWYPSSHTGSLTYVCCRTTSHQSRPCLARQGVEIGWYGLEVPFNKRVIIICFTCFHKSPFNTLSSISSGFAWGISYLFTKTIYQKREISVRVECK